MATNEEAAPKRMITILSQDKESFVVEQGVATMATLIEDLLSGTPPPCPFVIVQAPRRGGCARLRVVALWR